MQTFLPYPDFNLSAMCLDYRRLGKQRVEGMQILSTINIIKSKDINKKRGWINHPAVLMWINYEEALKEYVNTCISHWIKRGYKNNLTLFDINNVEYPKWFGNQEFHASHRSNLLRKNFEYYSQYGWNESIDLPYIWPKN